MLEYTLMFVRLAFDNDGTMEYFFIIKVKMVYTMINVGYVDYMLGC